MPLAPPEVDSLLEAAGDVRPMFVDAPTDPIRVPTAHGLAGPAGEEAARRYRTHGYAIIELTDELFSEETHLRATAALELGDPFVPPLYYLGGRKPSPVAVISQAESRGTQDASHPSFGRAVGQELHCDGTLQPLGYVKATLLSCRAPAASGGDTTLFDSVGAYAALLRTDRAAALALAHPRALVRRGTINGSDEECEGPAFSVLDGQLVGRYSVTHTDSLGAVDGAQEDLVRGMTALAAAASPGQPYFRTMRLAASQAIVFDNTRISHGRTPYRDAEGWQRCLFRTLHLEHPLDRRRRAGDGAASRSSR